MVRAGLGNYAIVGSDTAFVLHQFLQTGFRVQIFAVFNNIIQFHQNFPANKIGASLVAAVQVHGADNRLYAVGEYYLPRSAGVFGFTARHEQEFIKTQAAGNRGKHFIVNQRAPKVGKLAFRVAVVFVQIFRGAQFQNRVAQKLHTLIMGQMEASVLVQIRPVRKSRKVKVGIIDFGLENSFQFFLVDAGHVIYQSGIKNQE